MYMMYKVCMHGVSALALYIKFLTVKLHCPFHSALICHVHLSLIQMPGQVISYVQHPGCPMHDNSFP